VKFIEDALAESYSAMNTVIGLLRERLNKVEPARQWDVIHASELTKDRFCPREVAITQLLGMKRPAGKLSMALAATFGIGCATADMVREDWLGDHAYGNWRCLRCKMRRVFEPHPEEKTTEVPCYHVWKYEEVVLNAPPEYDFNGSLDLLISMHPGSQKLTLCELKIKDKDEFTKLIAPEPEHRIRTALYLWLAEHSTHKDAWRIDSKVGKVVYVARSFGKKNEAEGGEIMPFKEYDVPRDDVGIAGALRKAKEVAAFRSQGVMPAKAGDPYCPLSKGCLCAAACFSGKYPDGSTCKPSENG